MFKKHYTRPTCGLNLLDLESTILAESVVNDATMISSVGQEIGVDVTFTDDSFPNTNWEEID